MAHLQSTTISGSNANTGSLQVTGSTVIFPLIESSLTSSFSGSGKMWINADTQNIQYSFQTSLGTVNSPARFLGAWSQGGTMAFARNGHAGSGTQNAGLVSGGQTPTVVACTEEYDGDVWSAGGAMSIARKFHGGAGTQDATVASGGYDSTFCTVTEEYNGSSWSAGGALIYARQTLQGAGFQNSALMIGGYNPGSLTCNEEYNGTSYAAGGAMNIARSEFVGIGIQNAALAINSGNPVKSCVEQYDGTAWSTQNPRSFGICLNAGAGSVNAAFASGGGYPYKDCNEEWNGLTFVQAAVLPTAVGTTGGLGTEAAGIVAGGSANSGIVGCTQEYTKDFIPPYTTCVWTKGAGLITGRYSGAGGGITNAGLVFGGVVAPNRVSCTEEYDGTVYTAGGAMITARNNLAGGGTQNAGIAAGGEPSNDGRTEEYNGSTWSTGGSMSNGGYGMNGNGTQDKFIVQSKQPATVKSEKYNGSSWSATNDMNIARTAHLFIGDSDSGIILGGSPFSPVGLQTEEWDGTNYSSGPDLIFCTRDGGAGGTSNDGLAFGGYNPNYPVGHYRTQAYNGVAFSIDNPLTYSYKGGMGNGTPSAVGSFYAGGYNPGGSPYGGANTTQIASCCSSTVCSTFPVWSGAASLATARRSIGGAGTQNAALGFGGSPDGSAASSLTEEYDGTSWTAGGALIIARVNVAGAGTQNAGLAMGGAPNAAKTEEYNGSSWSEGGNAPATDTRGDGTGTQNAAVYAGGGSSGITNTEKYNGSSWSTSGALITAVVDQAVIGTQNAALSFGGSPAYANEEYNGTSWSTGGSLTQGGTFQLMGIGTQNTGLAVSGYKSGNQRHVEKYDGVSWSINKIVPVAFRDGDSGGGTDSSAGIFFGGVGPAIWANAFKYDCVASTCVGSWSIGGDLITARFLIGGFGTQNAGAAAGGGTPTRLSCNEEYNGSTWSAGGALITGRSILGAAGTQNEGVAFGGGEPTISNKTEEYNGTSWASSGNMITAREDGQNGMGTQNAALTGGGSTPSAVSCTEEYNGSTWSSGGNLITARTYLAGAGTQNAGVVFGGSAKTCTEEYNGSTWSASGALLIGRCMGGGTGDTQDAAVAISGFVSPTYYSCVERYNGIAWSTETGILHPRWTGGSAGSQTSALYFGGNTPSVQSHTEEFNCGANQIIGAGLQNFIANVTMETE